MKKNLLVACERSQAVCKAFRAKGWNAWSCDTLHCTGGHPEWHIKENALDMLAGFYYCPCGTAFPESYGKYGCCGVAKFHFWDMIIAFPPCTHLSVSGAVYWDKKKKDGRQNIKLLRFIQCYAGSDQL